MIKYIGIMLSIFLSVTSLQGQSAFFEHYNALEVQGEIPSDFLETSEERYARNAGEVAVEQKRASRIAEDRFFQINGLSSEMIRFSGRVLLNDTITAYLNKITDRLLKDAPVLRSRISVYTMRSSAVNAFATPDGMIMINLGLLTRFQNEDELAFVLAHEIAHVYKKHSLNSYMQKYHLETGTNSSKDYERSWEYHSYSQFSEMQADSLGYDLFNRAGYNQAAAVSVLKALGYAGYPYTNERLPAEKWQSNGFKLPTELLNSNYCTPVLEEGGGAESSHPALSMRLVQLSSFINPDGDTNSAADSAFAFFSEIALFESARCWNQDGDWVNGIYHTTMLLEKYPRNVFLERELARSFYIAAICRNRKDLDYYTEECGEIRRVYDLVYKQTKEQANTMLLRLIWDIHLRHPEDKDVLWYAFGIMTELASQHGIKSDFYNYHRNDFLHELGLTDSAGFSEIDSAYNAWAHAGYLNGDRDLYKYSFSDEKDDELFQKFLVKAQNILSDTTIVIYEVIDELIGTAPTSGGMLCHTPFAYYENVSRKEEETVNFGNMARIRQDIISSLLNSSDALNQQLLIMSPAMTKNASADNYNILGLLSEWIDCKVVFQDSSILVIPFPVTSIKRMEQACGGSKVVNTGYIQLQAAREVHTYSYLLILMSVTYPNIAWTLTKPHFAAVYYFQVFNIRTGMVEYDEQIGINNQVYRRSLISTHIHHSLRSQGK